MKSLLIVLAITVLVVACSMTARDRVNKINYPEEPACACDCSALPNN